jgi:cytochrome P450
MSGFDAGLDREATVPLKTLSPNFDAKDVVEDPRPTFEQIRAIGPVVKNDRLNAWMVVGYDEVLEVLHSPERFSNHAMGGDDPDIPNVMEGAMYMVNEDAPDHTRLRNVARDAFMRRSMRQFEATVQEVVVSILDGPELAGWARGEEIEAMAAYARMVPATAIAIILGTPTEDIPDFVTWSDALTAVMDNGQRGTDEWKETCRAAGVAGENLKGYLRRQIADHKVNKRDDLINDLLEANSNGDLAPDELLATCVLLLIAGNETTTKLIGYALRVLGERPELRQRLIDEPDLIVNAIEEFLRFEGVTATIPRIVREDLTLGGTELKAGDYVVLMLTATGRDPKRFKGADTLDVDRKDAGQHLGFGHGVHFCLGNTLARMEARLAVSAFISRFPNYSVTGHEMAPAFFARGLQTLTLVRG